MKNRAQRRAESKAKPAERQPDQKKTVLRIAILVVAAVMLLGVILVPFL